jgi:hypothetical protein
MYEVNFAGIKSGNAHPSFQIFIRHSPLSAHFRLKNLPNAAPATDRLQEHANALRRRSGFACRSRPA